MHFIVGYRRSSGISTNKSLIIIFLALMMALLAGAAVVGEADSGERYFVSNQDQNRDGEVELDEDRPIVGQIFTTGDNDGLYELTEVTFRVDNTARADNFNLYVALHDVVRGNRIGNKVVDMEGNLSERATNDFEPLSNTFLEANSKYMIVWRCDVGDTNDEVCNGSGEEVEIKLTDSTSEDSGKASGWGIADFLYREDADGDVSFGENPARIEVKGRKIDQVSIIDDGVNFIEAGALSGNTWPSRTIGDDTYGQGEIVVLTVEFSEAVKLANSPTFKVTLGQTERELSVVAHNGDTVYFGGLIQPHEIDTNGIWIGSGADSLGHNAAGSFRSAANTSQVSLDHPRLGTLSGHKVDGDATRPEIQRIMVTPAPQYADYYVRDEYIEVKVQFSEAVKVRGDAEARIDFDNSDSSYVRHADYDRGSGTNTLVFKHRVVSTDKDEDGIKIPANALAKDADAALGVEGGGSITGKNSGLLAHLASDAVPESQNSSVDGMISPQYFMDATIPEVIAGARWLWDEDGADSRSMNMDFTINEDPGNFAATQGLFLVLGFGYIGNTPVVFGLETNLLSAVGESSPFVGK